MGQHKYFECSVSSSSTNGRTYRVARFTNGTWKCDCPDFWHRSVSNPNHTCKHIKEEMSKECQREHTPDATTVERAVE